MARTYRQQFLAVIRDNETRMTGMFRDLHSRILVQLTRAGTGPGGIIPPQNSHLVRAQVSQEVTRTFVLPIGTGVAPYDVRDRRVVPVSPYMVILWSGIEQVTRIAVEQHASIMRDRLKKAPDVLDFMLRARRSPFVAARQVQEQVFHPRPFLRYDPAHLFVDPRGYRLSDRIWDTSNMTRRRIDQFLTEAIAEGRSSTDIARELEQFLLPGRRLVRSNKPYGTDVSFDAMRLARTEITANHARAQRMAALLNPFVEEYDIVVSRQHKVLDECDIAASSGPYRWDDDNAPHVPLHPQCLCNEQTRVSDQPDTIEHLREEIVKVQSEPDQPDKNRLLVSLIGALLVDRFVRLLLDEPELESEYDTF